MGLRTHMRYLALLLAVLATVFTGCSGGSRSTDQDSPEANPTVASSSQDDQVAIYSAVIRQVTLKDDTAGGKFPKPVIYILRVTDSTVGNPQWRRSESSTLSVATQEHVARALSDLPARIEWVDRFEDVELAPDSTVEGGGVVVTLGKIELKDQTRAWVPASIYLANLGSGGQTYVVTKSGGAWNVTGTTGTRWES